MTKYFKKDEDLKKQYRELCKRLHPDHGGNEAEFKEMVAEYEDIQLNGFQEQAKMEDIKLSEVLQTALRKVIVLDGVEIELVGTWIWLSGNTYQYREQIKQAGFKWGAKRKKWYFSEEKAKGKFKGDFEALKAHHGFVEIANVHMERIA